MGPFLRAFSTAVKRADITRKGKAVHFTPKVLRKAHANWQAERRTNECVLQGLLGHAKGSRVTQQYYGHVTEQAKRAAVITLPVGE